MCVLYFDLETVPDEDRAHLWRDTLDVTHVEMPEFELMCNSKVDVLSRWLAEPSCSLEWCAGMLTAERGGKNRKTAVAAIKSRMAALLGPAKTGKDKPDALIPERCRIVAFGMALDGREVEVYSDEREGLERFWHYANGERTWPCGYNIQGFDLDVIAFRSMMLDIDVPKRFGRNPFGSRDVCDLMVTRFGRQQARRFVTVAREWGFVGPADEVMGRDVPALWETQPEKVIEHVTADVERCRFFHQKLYEAGYEVPRPAMALAGGPF